MGSNPQKTQESPKKFYHIPSCRAFFADQFEKKNYLIPSRNDGTEVKILASTDRPNDQKVILGRFCLESSIVKSQ